MTLVNVDNQSHDLSHSMQAHQSLHHNGVLFLFDVKQQSINQAM